MPSLKTLLPFLLLTLFTSCVIEYAAAPIPEEKALTLEEQKHEIGRFLLGHFSLPVVAQSSSG